jgi:hypothetical protein
VAATGGSLRRLTNEPSDEYIPSWSHDGKWIYFSSTRTSRNEIWKAPADGGGPALQVTRNGGFTAFESPDGSIYYTKSDSGTKLWQCKLDGNDETEVVDRVASRAFVVTRDLIYYLRAEDEASSQQPTGRLRTLRSYQLSTGQDRLIANIAKQTRLGLSLSADNRYLIYSQEDNEGSDLLLVPNFR